MLCQTCSALNEDDREFCFRCQNKLLVLSGVSSFEEDEVEVKHSNEYEAKNPDRLSTAKTESPACLQQP